MFLQCIYDVRHKKKNIRECESYRLFRHRVLARDSYKCQFGECCIRSCLEVHHIRKYSEHETLREDPYNGIVLCRRHHSEISGKEEEYEDEFFRKVLANASQPSWEKLDAPKRYSQQKKSLKNSKRRRLRKRNRRL